MKELIDLLHELRCDINYCKVSFENDTEIANTEETLLKIEKIVKNYENKYKNRIEKLSFLWW